METLELRSGATLILSRFNAGEPRSFHFTEPEDMFGFGFHLKGGAQFEMENSRFETRSWDVWSSAAPQGSTSAFSLPQGGFLTASIRFKPDVAEAFFADDLALPKNARGLLDVVREQAGSAQLPSLTPAAAQRLQSMFATPYHNAARRLYLESCALDLLAQQVANLCDTMADMPSMQSRHRDKALAARECLESQLQNPPTIAELSKLVGTNEFTLKQAFKQTHGTTIFAYVSKRRMERATVLLRQGMSVSSTAEEVGYGCTRSFSNAYRRETGNLPSAIRRGHG